MQKSYRVGVESLFSFLWAILCSKKGEKKKKTGPGSECPRGQLLAAEAPGQPCIFTCVLTTARLHIQSLQGQRALAAQ